MIQQKIHSNRVILPAGLGLIAVLGGLAALNPLLAVAAALLLLLWAYVAPRPIVIVYALVFILPLVGGFARGTFIPLLRVGQALLVLGFLLFALSVPGRQGKMRLTFIDFAFAFYFLTEAVFPVLAMLYRGDPLNLSQPNFYDSSTPLQTLFGPVQYYMLYRIVVATVSTKEQITTIFKLSFVSSILVSIIGIMQKVGVAPVTSFLNAYYPQPNLYPHGGVYIPIAAIRITSTLESYSGLAAYLCFTLILALTCYTVLQGKKICPLFLIVTMLIDSAALFLTGTFSAFLGLAIGAVIIFLILRRVPRLLIVVVAGFALFALLFPAFIIDRVQEWLGGGSSQALLPTFAARITLWERIFLPAIGQHIVFGSGPSPLVSQLWISEESQYIALLLRGGIFYLFSYLVLIGAALLICWRLIKQGRERPGQLAAIALFAILIAMSCMNVSAVYFTYAGGTQTIWTLLAVVVAAGQFGSPRMQVIDRRIAEEQRRTTRWLSMVRLRRLLDWRFVKDSAVVGLGSTSARLLGLLFTTLLAHYLTPGDFGLYRYLITLASIVTFVATASPASIARFIAAHPQDEQAQDLYFTNSVLGLALLMLVSLLISIPVLFYLHALNAGTVACIIGMTAFYGYLAIVRGQNDAWKMGLAYVLSNVALVAALFLLIDLFKLRTASTAAAIYGLTDLVPIVLLELIRPMKLRFQLRLVSGRTLLELARFALPILIATGAYTLWSGLDMLLVQNLVPSAAGDYAVAKTVSGAFVFVPAAISMVLMPHVAALDPKKSKRYCVGAALIALLISIGGLAVIMLWGHALIALAFGQRYDHAYLPLIILIVGMSFYAVYAILEGFVIGHGRPGLSVLGLSAALGSTALTGFWLTAQLGALGASLAFTLGAVLGTAILLVSVWRFLYGDSFHREGSVSKIVASSMPGQR